MTLFAIFYFIAVVAAVVFVLRQLARMADAQEKSSRHLYEIARDIKYIAVSKVEGTKTKRGEAS